MPENLLDIRNTDTTYSNATQSKDGLMSAGDKKKLDEISSGATNTAIDLLWTNPNPYTALSGLTVTLDLSKYKLLIIDFVNEVGKAHYTNGQVFSIGDNCCVYGSGHNNGAVLRRQFTTSIDKIVFQGASYDAGSGNSNLLIPYHIYGIK